MKDGAEVEAGKEYLYHSLFELISGHLNLKYAPSEVYRDAKRILILRSGSLPLFTRLVRNIRDVNPDARLTVITHDRDRQEVERICGAEVEIAAYTSTGSYDAKEMSPISEQLRNRSFDQYVMMFNNRSGIDYGNVVEAMLVVTDKPLLVYNGYDEWLTIPNPLLYLKTLDLLKAFMAWYWEEIVDLSAMPEVNRS